MPEKAVFLLVVEGFADWEPAHAVAELAAADSWLAAAWKGWPTYSPPGNQPLPRDLRHCARKLGVLTFRLSHECRASGNNQ